MSKSSDNYLSTLAAEIRGPVIPADAFSASDLAREAGITVKAAHNRLAKEVAAGKLETCMGRRPNDIHKMAYFYPVRKKP